MLGLTMLVTWAGSMHDRFGPQPPEASGARGPVAADRAAAGERLRALAALPLAARRDEVAQRSPDATTCLLADLFGYGATCEDPWRVHEDAGLLADVLEGIGAALVVGQDPRGNDVRRMTQMLAAQTHLMRGIAADATGHRAEAHRHFSLAAHPGAARVDGVAFALGTAGAALTDDGTDRASLADVPAPARDVLGPLEEMCGHELTGLRRALTVRCAAYDVVATVAEGGDHTEGSREAVLKRWLERWGPGADAELWIAWTTEFFRGLARAGNEDEARGGAGSGGGGGLGDRCGEGDGSGLGDGRRESDGCGLGDGRWESGGRGEGGGSGLGDGRGLGDRCGEGDGSELGDGCGESDGRGLGGGRRESVGRGEGGGSGLGDGCGESDECGENDGHGLGEGRGEGGGSGLGDGRRESDGRGLGGGGGEGGEGLLAWAALGDRVLAAGPGRPGFRWTLARHLRAQGATAREIRVLTALVADDPADVPAVRSLANAYAGSNRLDEAVALLRSRISDPPVPDDEPFVELIVLLLTARLRPEAAEWDEELARITGGRHITDVLPTTGNAPAPAAPPPVHALFRDGTLLLDPDSVGVPPGEVAAQLWAAMIAGSPDGADRLKQLAEEEPGLAAKVAKVLGVPLVTRAQREASELIGQGEHHFHRGEYTDAATYYQRALDADPESSLALLMLGDVHFVRRETGLARVYFQESLAVEETPMAWRFLGDTFRDTLDGTQEARRCYARALALDPGYGGARQALEALPPPAVVPDPAPATGEATAKPPAAEPPAPARFGAPYGGPIGLPLSGPAAGTGIKDTLPAELEAAVREREPVLGELLAAAGDDGRFDAWLRAEGADHWADALDTLRMTVFQWAAKAGDFERSLLLARRGVQIAEHLDRQWPAGDPEEPGRARLLADALKQAAGVLDAMGRYSEAYDLLCQTERWLVTDEHERERTGRDPWLDYGQFSGLDHWTELYRDLARVARRCGDAAAAEEYQRRLDEITADVPDSDHERIVSLVELALAWHELGERERALSWFHETLPLAEREALRSPVPIALAIVHHHLGVVLGEQGFPRMALHHLAEARERDSGNADRLAQDWLATAAVLRRRPDLGHAVLAYEQVLHLSGVPGQRGDPLFWAPRSEPTATRGRRVLSAERAWPAILPMARAAWEHGEPYTATDVLELGVELADLVRAAEPNPERRGHLQDGRAEAYELLTRYRLQRAESEARRAAEAGPATDGSDRPDRDPGHHIAAAFTASERLRARSLLDAMSTARLRAPDGVPPDLLADEAALIAERAALAAAPAVDWKRHYDLTARLDALWRRLAGYGPPAEEYVGVRRATVMDPAAVSRELAGQRTVVASYALLDTGEIALFTLGGDGDEGPVRVTPVDADGAAVLRFIGDNLGSAGRVREMAEDMPGLFHRVLDPLVAPLAALTRPEDTVVICPTGALHHVPFHALSPDGSGALIDRNAVAYLPTVSLLRTLTHRAPVAGGGAVVLGDPGGDLPHARDEALALGGRLGCAPLLGEGATRERVLRALPGAEVFHAACHASFDAADPLSSGLVLADGVLTARDILRQDWHGVRLAVLSACETGLGRTSRTDETLGLSWSLLYAGVRSLVMSLWRVPDATTAALMGDFHDLTAAGEAPGAALRTAMLAARDRPGGGRLESWAAFCLLGDWRAPHPDPRTATRGSTPC
ncbi:CHAT domain-containing protein [Streptomyces sp. AN091965]|uniref:CHAT domain-containing protein n=1 Tax=Streptomyces sp. AN091965 TaxID=2927803 RepID=UPI0027E50221|nr:CHAT domain-containing tetratricopeptide repeat protein [Streptomyces sp. AN091965]